MAVNPEKTYMERLGMNERMGLIREIQNVIKGAEFDTVANGINALCAMMEVAHKGSKISDKAFIQFLELGFGSPEVTPEKIVWEAEMPNYTIKLSVDGSAKNENTITPHNMLSIIDRQKDIVTAELGFQGRSLRIVSNSSDELDIFVSDPGSVIGSLFAALSLKTQGEGSYRLKV